MFIQFDPIVEHIIKINEQTVLPTKEVNNCGVSENYPLTLKRGLEVESKMKVEDKLRSKDTKF